MKHITLFIVLLMGTLVSAFGQPQLFGKLQLPGKPALTNIDPYGYPRVLDNGQVMFGLKAPEAHRVQVQIEKSYDMKKDANGFWTCMTTPLLSGFHYYSLVIDGANVSDPASESFWGCGRMSSAIDLPETGCDFYDLKDVPHGTIRFEHYFSKETNSWRPVYIYTPPGYDEGLDYKYPVLYIQHGGGEDHGGWVNQGKVANILDNLIAGKRARKMIVVMANGNMSHGGYNKKGMEPFINEIVNNVIPFVESHYHVMADAEDRAIAGLSMGGGQAFYAGLQHTLVFKNIGIFSSGIFGGVFMKGMPVFDAEKEIPGILSDAGSFNQRLKLLYISVGEQDVRLESTKKQVDIFRGHGLNVVFATFSGGHEWQVWRKSLHDFASKLF